MRRERERWDGVGREGQGRKKGAPGKEERRVGEGRWEREGGGRGGGARQRRRARGGTRTPKPNSSSRTDGVGGWGWEQRPRRTARLSSPRAPGCLSVRPPGLARTGDVPSRRGLSGQFCWGFVAAFPETGARGEPGRPSQVGAAPCAPHARGPPAPLGALPALPGLIFCLGLSHTSWLLLRPLWPTSPFPSPSPGTVRPASPARPATVPPEAKTNSPEGTSRSVRRPDGTLGRMKGGGRPPRGPRRIMGARQIAGGT